MGLKHRGLITDAAVTVIVGNGDKDAQRLVESTKAALEKVLLRLSRKYRW